MFERLQQILKISDLRKKILFVLLMLVIFRVAANIPVPGVDKEALRSFLGNSQFFGLLNIFSGGALTNLSIAMLGVGPYITGSIIMQLLTMIFPRLKEMYQEEGEAGRARFNQYSRLLTVPLGLLQAYGLLIILSRQNILPHLGIFGFLTNMVVITAGTMFLVWIGELISEKGIGNGISLMIFAGIVSGLPTNFGQFVFDVRNSPEKLPSYLVFAAIALIVVAGVVYITEAQRNIPVSYAKRVRGNRVYGGVSTHLPLRVNQAGVIPIIFAVSIVLFPGLIGSFLAGVPNSTAQFISDFLIKMFNNQWIYGSVYFVLVFVFTYFYTAVTFDPQSIADNIQKQGGFVLGIRPGRQTAEYLYRIINRITLVGAVFLGLTAVLPIAAQGVFAIQTFTIGGTALLIAVSVVLETLKQVQSQIVTYEYE
ncbi:MAG: preprotein translocase subunit SecY [Candidatus Sungbacteria bacterium RIFCSPLOWO2_01_FULL_47_32]|uniref:Protein translocase subunit SecY n=1 Tax=Candidatus Sungbacteria bacterium RIFCSPHIGHO2_01_FULL_47_32 TaxID=1802264 RepID=A0A1G2K4M2_9BACT|nr:MAG: preprotein translocase subunit SecY [Candidatus Sungbacteria bacterium RIFCSPHIGHO2_01_FULL_47_32]OHA04930.1 MAG: preprotein translocase subunit SecY [Candidatus Sungbacteria bacterium RIFCSPLOWO2_01_FULL_47_32]